MNTNKQLHSLLAGATSLLLLVAILCWMEPGQAAAAGDNGHDVTLAELQQKGPQIASEFTGHRANHRQLANFAWREFIALCAPAGILPANRGAPDANRSFVDSGDPNFYQKGKRPRQLGTNLLVWETYAHRSELFPHNQLRGQPWRSAPKYIYGATENGKRPVFNTGVLQLYNNLDEASQIDQNLLFFPTNPPNPFQRNGRYDPNKDVQVLFEAKVNRAEYAYGQTLPAPPSKGGLPPVDLPPNSQSSGTSVEIKAAWRMLTPGMDRSRYHTADAVYYTGTDKRPIAKNGTFGLVGLHIIHKTKMYPTFIFATFEQIDALTQPNRSPTGLYFITNYTKLAYKGGPNAPQAYINNGGVRVHAVPLPPAGSLPTHGLPPPHAGPFKVVQPPTITTDVTAVNRLVEGLMKHQFSGFSNSVWRHYRLKGVQAIPTNEQSPSRRPDPETLDFYLANIVVESSQPGIQLFKGGVGSLPAPRFTVDRRQKDVAAPPNPYNKPQYVMGGCMGCHGVAQQGGGDFSFLFVGRRFSLNGFTADAVGLQTEEVMKARAKKYPTNK